MLDASNIQVCFKMNFRIKILDIQNPKPMLREVYRLEEVITLIEKRYSTIPEISYDPMPKEHYK